MASFTLHRTRLGTPGLLVAQTQSIASRAQEETPGHSVRTNAVKSSYGGGAAIGNLAGYGCRGRIQQQNPVPEQSVLTFRKDARRWKSLRSGDPLADTTGFTTPKRHGWSKRGSSALKRELCNLNTIEVQRRKDASALLQSTAKGYCDECTSERRSTKTAAHAAYLEPAAAGAIPYRTLQLGNVCTEETLVLLRRAQRIHPKFFAAVTVVLLIGYLTGSAIASANVQVRLLALR